MTTRRRRIPSGSPVLLGWYEYVDFPGWGLRKVKAKIDTGARTTSLHVENLEELPGRRVRFDVIRRRGHRRPISVEADVRRKGRVRASNGVAETRVFVATRIRIGPHEREIELNLVDRGDMNFLMILGRTTLTGWPTLIDVSRSCIASDRPRRRGHREGSAR